MLEFFCDWPLHSVLDRRKAQRILQTFDEFVSESRKAGGSVSEKAMNTVQPLISFRVFQSDLIVFLTEHGLDTAVATDIDRYRQLLFFFISARSNIRHLRLLPSCA
ncbi:MAG: hypothetical protein JWN34_4047 [Bryobacterales bacterium]|nr:hypothetical protein [Bryobacterales bacterium]